MFKLKGVIFITPFFMFHVKHSNYNLQIHVLKILKKSRLSYKKKKLNNHGCRISKKCFT